MLPQHLSLSVPELRYDPAIRSSSDAKDVRVLTTAPPPQHNANALVAKPDRASTAQYGRTTGRTLSSFLGVLISLGQHVSAEDLHLEILNTETVRKTKEQTIAVPGLQRSEASRMRSADMIEFLQYTPTTARDSRGQTKMMKKREYPLYQPTKFRHFVPSTEKFVKIPEKEVDICETPKGKQKRIPCRAPSPSAPVHRSPPPRVLSTDQQDRWKIPPLVSGWKNTAGYSIPLDKRLTPDGIGLQNNPINVRTFHEFCEALEAIERYASEDVGQRAVIQQRINENDRLQNEESLRHIACQQRKDRTNYTRRSASPFDSEDEAIHRRLIARIERRREFEREERRTKL